MSEKQKILVKIYVHFHSAILSAEAAECVAPFSVDKRKHVAVLVQEIWMFVLFVVRGTDIMGASAIKNRLAYREWGGVMNHIGTIRLKTDRLILRRFTINDAEEMFNNWASDDDVTKYLTWPTHQNIETTQGYINYCIQGYSGSAFYQWVMESKETHELIGNISVVQINEEIDGLELGWVIRKKYWGNGYTAEAAKEVIEFLFDKVGANCIYAKHDVNNPNSGRVMQKAGMKYEGTLRQSSRNNQGIADMAHYSVIRADR